MADEITIKSEAEIRDLQSIVELMEKKAILDKQDIEILNQKKTVISSLSESNNQYKDIVIVLNQRIDNLISSNSKLNDTISNTEKATDSVSKSFSLFNNITESASYYLNQLTTSFGNVQDQVNKYNNLTREQANLSALAIAGITGIESRFNNLNFDSSKFTLFKDDVNNFVKTLSESNLGEGVKFIDQLFGGSAPDDVKNKIGKALETGATAAVDVVKGIISDFANATDNTQKLTQAFYQMSAATGNLNSLQGATGPNFENLNNLIATQSRAMDKLSADYKIAPEVVEKYYSLVAKIPGALQETIQGYDGASSRLTFMQGAFLQSMGSGRDFDDVLKDIHQSIRTYGGGLQEAIDLTARISELSNNYKVELNDVKNYILSTADSFKFFGNEMEGSSRLFNTYFDAFEKTGLSKASSVEMINNMTGGIERLTIAQKAFLSSQTGGIGGLAGAFEIEKELREGNIDKVFDRVRETLKKQMGEIVSLEEASVSQEAASRLTKQIAMVKEGPLGQFAKTDQQALRLLEAFDKQEKGESIIKELREDPSSFIMEEGNKLAQRGNNILFDILSEFRKTRNLTEVVLADTLMDALSPAKVREQESVDKLQLRENKEIALRASQQSEVAEIETFSRQMSGEEEVKDVFARRLIDSIRSIEQTAKNVPVVGLNTLDQTKNFSATLPISQENVLNENLRNRQLDIQNSENDNLKYSTKLQSELQNQNSVINNIPIKIMSEEIANSQNINNKAIFDKEINNTNPQNINYSDEVVRSINVQSENKKFEPQHTNNVSTNENNSNKQLGQIHVEVSGYCIDCGTKMNNRSHIGVINPVR